MLTRDKIMALSGRDLDRAVAEWMGDCPEQDDEQKIWWVSPDGFRCNTIDDGPRRYGEDDDSANRVVREASIRQLADQYVLGLMDVLDCTYRDLGKIMAATPAQKCKAALLSERYLLPEGIPEDEAARWLEVQRRTLGYAMMGDEWLRLMGADRVKRPTAEEAAWLTQGKAGETDSWINEPLAAVTPAPLTLLDICQHVRDYGVGYVWLNKDAQGRLAEASVLTPQKVSCQRDRETGKVLHWLYRCGPGADAFKIPADDVVEFCLGAGWQEKRFAIQQAWANDPEVRRMAEVIENLYRGKLRDRVVVAPPEVTVGSWLDGATGSGFGLTEKEAKIVADVYRGLLTINDVRARQGLPPLEDRLGNQVIKPDPEVEAVLARVERDHREAAQKSGSLMDWTDWRRAMRKSLAELKAAAPADPEKAIHWQGLLSREPYETIWEKVAALHKAKEESRARRCRQCNKPLGRGSGNLCGDDCAAAARASGRDVISLPAVECKEVELTGVGFGTIPGVVLRRDEKTGDTVVELVCECGADKAGTTHASYCPKAGG